MRIEDLINDGVPLTNSSGRNLIMLLVRRSPVWANMEASNLALTRTAQYPHRAMAYPRRFRLGCGTDKDDSHLSELEKAIGFS